MLEAIQAADVDRVQSYIAHSRCAEEESIGVANVERGRAAPEQDH